MYYKYIFKFIIDVINNYLLFKGLKFQPNDNIHSRVILVDCVIYIKFDLFIFNEIIN